MVLRLNICITGVFFATAGVWVTRVDCCGPLQTVTIPVPPDGRITSPKYPRLDTGNNTRCLWMWNLVPARPNTTIVITMEDLDLDAGWCGKSEGGGICCRGSWLSLPISSPTFGGITRLKKQRLCGDRANSSQPLEPIMVRTSIPISIKLYVTRGLYKRRGFALSYRAMVDADAVPHIGGEVVGGSGCEGGNLRRCATGGGCFSDAQKCDGWPHCADWSDETDCSNCLKGEMSCSAVLPDSPATPRSPLPLPLAPTCFRPSQRCDGMLDCPMGQDEVDCVPGCSGGRIGCLRGDGCYAPRQRCDGRADCGDESDEAGCPPPLHLCLPVTQGNSRKCRNGRCLAASLWCNAVDDCGDNSDEQDCYRTAIVVAVVLALLLCGTMTVVAVACALRTYFSVQRLDRARRLMRIPPHIAERLRMSTCSRLPALLDDDFFLREPPPVYAVAVGEMPPAPPYPPPYRPTARRSRRHGWPRPVPPPQVLSKPSSLALAPSHGQANSSQGHSPPTPSRTSRSPPSSSPHSTSSSTDDTLLLSY